MCSIIERSILMKKSWTKTEENMDVERFQHSISWKTWTEQNMDVVHVFFISKSMDVRF